MASGVVDEMNGGIATSGRARVLVVEDSDDQRDLVRTYLAKAGCTVIAVENAEDAIAECQRGVPDLAIIDLLLPGMNGWELVRRLRSDFPQVAIAVSSVLDTSDYPTTEAMLPKPFTRAQILQVLSDCVPE